jgi:hypothetical protein
VASTGKTVKAEAWALYDRLIESAATDGLTNPWSWQDGAVVFSPDYETAAKLLAVPILLDAAPTTGVRALALDVWIAYELRRAGFEPDSVWPRAEAPRIMPSTFTALRAAANKKQAEALDSFVRSGKTYNGEIGATANILGKNYVKQVDVVISAWDTGPELMISTKRMDSSFGNNAANRVEESYGDAKNLRSRHPQAALGFVFSLRSTAFDEQPPTAAWIVDLLGKLGREDDAYDAVALLVPEWSGAASSDDAIPDEEQPLAAAGIEPGEAEALFPAPVPEDEIDQRLATLPEVVLRHDLVPGSLSPGVFLDRMVRRVLDNCPINFHVEARARLNVPSGRDPLDRQHPTIAVDHVPDHQPAEEDSHRA